MSRLVALYYCSQINKNPRFVCFASRSLLFFLFARLHFIEQMLGSLASDLAIE